MCANRDAIGKRMGGDPKNMGSALFFEYGRAPLAVSIFSPPLKKTQPAGSSIRFARDCASATTGLGLHHEKIFTKRGDGFHHGGGQQRRW
jgi:hypothetical protein